MELKKEIIKNLIIDHINIVVRLLSIIDPDVDYMAICWIKEKNNNEKDYYSLDSTNHDGERIINFNEFI